MEHLAKAIGILCLLSLIVLIFTIPAAAMWYTFDDKLAEITGVASLGTIPFWNMYGFTWFIGLLGLGRSTASSAAKKAEGQ